MEKKLAGILRAAFETVPYYNNLFLNCGVDVYQEEPLEILAKLPVTDKETIKAINNVLRDASMHMKNNYNRADN